ncbi:MAG: hypothetical protein HPY50_05990 [Firmicutes bacterium]|nr:hypothetical protein [Bacillota bacterium]
MYEIDASGVHYQQLNQDIHELLDSGISNILVKNVAGQRFIGCGIKGSPHLTLAGVPGNNLGSYMDGMHIEVLGNCQDGIGNTMNSGTIVVHGHAGDIVGYAMRGGVIYVRGDVGYRSGIHMKAYQNKFPVIVVGGRAGNFLGEYMAGGVIIILGLNLREELSAVGDYLGTGMHGGAIYVRGQVEKHRLAKEVIVSELDDKDRDLLDEYVGSFCSTFAVKIDYKNDTWTKLVPGSSRPYGALYNHK